MRKFFGAIVVAAMAAVPMTSNAMPSAPTAQEAVISSQAKITSTPVYDEQGRLIAVEFTYELVFPNSPDTIGGCYV